MFNIGSDPVIGFAVALAIAITLIIALLFVEIMVLRLRLRRGERARDRTLDTWRPLMAATIAGDQYTVPLPRVRKNDWPYLAYHWNQLFSSIRGPQADSLRRLGRDAGLGKVAQRWLKRQSLRWRLLGVVSMGNLGDETAWDSVLIHVDDENPYLSLAAAQALLRLDARRGLPIVLTKALERDDWSMSRVVALLREVGSERSTHPVIAALRRASGGSLRRAVAWLAAIDHRAAQNAVSGLLDHHDPEVVAAACRRALDPSLAVKLRPLLQHSAWFVRLQAAVALGRCGDDEDLKLLQPLLDDEHWWIRRRVREVLEG